MQGTNWAKLALVVGVALVSISVRAAEDEQDRPSPAALVSLARTVAPSLVVVEITPQTDKGETPTTPWTRETLLTRPPHDWGALISEERPAEFAGYLLPGQRVVTTDPMLHPRFIKRIAVRQNDQVVDASIAAYGRDRDALVLRLAEPLPDGRPLEFDTSRPGPYCQVRYTLDEGTWVITVKPLTEDEPAVRVTAGRPPERGRPDPGLYVDPSGTPVGLTWKKRLAVDEDWRQTPEDWPLVTADEMRAALANVEQLAAAALLRVNLRFRSPRNPAGASPYRMHARFEEGDSTGELTEWNGVGVLVDETTVLVLANLKPKVTARLETIHVFTADDQRVDATFAGTLEDYGAFLAKLAQPLPGGARCAAEPIKDYEEQLVLKAQVRVLGESRFAYFWRDRLTSFAVGWRRQIYPRVAADASREAAPWEDNPTPGLNFLYTLDGRLLIIPLARRQPVATDQSWRSWSPFSASAGVLAATYLTPVLAAREQCIDPENRPLTEEEENRLAWLGVELQALNPELARMNNVAEQTANGTSGAMVMYIYPDSPAAAAGLELGDILLRLHIEGYPRPMKVQLADRSPFSGMLANMPRGFYDQSMPKPWGAVENALTRALTDVGFGKRFTIEVFRKGQVLTKNFVVTQGPAYYDSAKRFKSKAAGFTVRDVTYEVRRYYQMTAADPGVIVSKVERGSPAAVAGIQPLELIVSIDDAPVRRVADLEQALAPGGEFRLNVKRLTASRVVTLKIKPEAKAD